MSASCCPTTHPLKLNGLRGCQIEPLPRALARYIARSACLISESASLAIVVKRYADAGTDLDHLNSERGQYVRTRSVRWTQVMSPAGRLLLTSLDGLLIDRLAGDADPRRILDQPEDRLASQDG